MTMEEAQEILQEIKHYLTAGNPVWDVDEIAEACDMAIEALSAEAEQVTGKLNKRDDSLLTEDSDACKEQKSKLDLISIQMAIEHWGRSSGNLTNNQIAELQREIESLPSADEQDDNRLYIRIYANDEPSRKAEKLYQICGETESQEVAQWLKEYFPSADRPTTDCTEFMEWLKAEVLDEYNWELNAVAYGEIICRKLKKLGWIDVEDGFYVDTRPTGEWVDIDNYYRMATCSRCHKVTMFEKWGEYTRSYNYCPNCGADMRGEEE